MIPITEFVSLLRKRLDERLDKQGELIIEGRCLDSGSAEATAMTYAQWIGFTKGINTARFEVDDLVKQLNAGEL